MTQIDRPASVITGVALVIALAAMSALGGCGRKPGDATVAAVDAATASATARAAADAAAGAAAASAASPAMDCGELEPSVKSGPDVIGIRIGMTVDEVTRILGCAGLSPAVSPAGGNYNYLNYNFVPPLNGVMPVGKITGQDSESAIGVVFFGGPGEERVVGIQRVLVFSGGSEPLLTQIKTQIALKYGALEDVYRRKRPGDDYIVARLDRFVGESSVVGPVGLCLDSSNGIENDVAAFSNSGPHCGLMVTVRANAKSDNPELVTALNISVSNGLYADQLRTAYMARVQTAEARRKRDEVQQAETRKPVL